jgi:two-component system cell cycle sensor histidine kinase/response regulator CckA
MRGFEKPRSADSRVSQVASIDSASEVVTTILIVEDEELLRLAVGKALTRRGFLVLEARDGNEAISALGDYTGDIHLMLLDLTLPGISSREVFEHAKRTRPTIKVILTSAYPKKTAEATFAGLMADLFIRKPYSVADLVDSLRSL